MKRTAAQQDVDQRARFWLQKIQALPEPREPFNLLNVCGGHERSITLGGLRSVLPKWINLIPGPGCPVCVCPESDIALAIRLAAYEDTIVLAFGDMLRVPISLSAESPALPKGLRSLEQAKACGADIRPIASPMEALAIAQQNPQRCVVFFAAGFETTMAPVAALAHQHFCSQLPSNLQFLISGRRTWPAVAQLLADNRSAHIHGLVAPGHVATIMGSNEWQFVIDDHSLATAVAGFESDSLLHAFYSILSDALEPQQPANLQLRNCYPQAVSPQGNKRAQAILQQCFDIGAASWRGIGNIEQSGYHLNISLQAHDARFRFAQHNQLITQMVDKNVMPKSCMCADVVMARRLPNQCALYGKSCTPRQPVGPCMVSDEGACRIWLNGGIQASDRRLSVVNSP